MNQFSKAEEPLRKIASELSFSPLQTESRNDLGDLAIYCANLLEATFDGELANLGLPEVNVGESFDNSLQTIVANIDGALRALS